VHARGGGYGSTEFYQGGIGMALEGSAYHRLGLWVQAWPPPSSVGLRGDVPHSPIAAQQLLHERDTDTEEVSNRALGAQPPLVGVENLLS
jgi:hypothetical protein